jgi:DNA-binding protein YbaB
MNRPPFAADLEADDIARLLQSFTDDAKHAVEASADGLVTVRMGPTFTILSIDFFDSGLDQDQRRRLETATLTAVNAAIRKVALSSGQVLLDFQANKAAQSPKRKAGQEL